MITQTQLLQVREYASLFFTLEEISILTLIDLEALRREVNFGHSELNNAYWLGKMEGQVTLRKQVKEWAEKGSPAAEDKLLEWLKQQNESE
jgi:hypothetical protein